MTRKQFRTQITSDIMQIADLGDDGAIQCNVDLIRSYLKEGNLDEVEKRLKEIESCCKDNFARLQQSYHALEMMRHFALAIGDKYDPMY